MNTQRPDAEAKREAILAAAQRLFLDNGFAATSMSQIAKAAGVTKSLIHHHFKNKDALWLAVKVTIFDEYFQAQRDILERQGDSRDLLIGSFTAYFEFLSAHPEVVRLISHSVAEGQYKELPGCMDCEEQPSFMDLYDLGVESIRQAQQAGTIRNDVSPVSIISMFFSLTEHWFETKNHTLTHLPDPAQAETIDQQYLSDIIKIVLGGILQQNS